MFFVNVLRSGITTTLARGGFRKVNTKSAQASRFSAVIALEPKTCHKTHFVFANVLRSGITTTLKRGGFAESHLITQHSMVLGRFSAVIALESS